LGEKRLCWFWGFGNWVCFAEKGVICRARILATKAQRDEEDKSTRHKKGRIGVLGRRQKTGDRRQNTKDGFPRDGMQANPKLQNPEVVKMGVFNIFLRHALSCAPLLIGFYSV
jgi:hypothetical protein